MKSLTASSKALRMACGLAALCACTFAMAEPEALLVIKNHRFEPAEITVPAGKKVKLTINNQDPEPEEFESHDLNREKVIPGNTKGTVWIGPLNPGTYGFFGEYHEDTAKGRIIVK